MYEDEVLRTKKYLMDMYIKDYPKDYYETKKSIFLQESYSKSTAIEIIKLLNYGGFDVDPKRILEWYIDEIVTFMETKSNTDSEWMFSVSYDVATDVLSLLYSFMEEE